ncbi:MAG: response regulator [Deltaproteobacteria bacterium]|nr:response regulator [Deltaproteobacteria bacterium]
MLDLEGQRLLDLFHQAPGFVAFVRGRDHVFDLVNPAYYQLVGHRDILNKPVREALPEVAGQGFFELLDNVFTTGEAFVGRRVPLLVQREPGAPLTEAFVDFVYQPIRAADGAVIGILAQGNDVTDLKREEARREEAESALRASEQRYRALFESIDDGYALIEMLFDDQDHPVDYRFLETNAAFEAQTGLVQAVGKTALELVPDLDRSWFERYGKVALDGDGIRFENHAPAMGRWFDVYAGRAGDPSLRQVALVFKDVTERKRAEADRESLLVRESAARTDAEVANRLKDDFLAMVSHELRTPLMAMLGWVQMLRTGELPPDRVSRGLETIERNARAQAQVIDDLLDVSGILSGKLRLELELVELARVVEGAIESIRLAAEAKHIRIQAALSAGTVMGDPTRLQQITWNLLSNAVKFTPDGGTIQIMMEPGDRALALTIVDSGAGVASEFIPYVFERFRQGDAGTTRKHGGLGLGLSIVKHLVEAHGGRISVTSEGPGKGTTFTVQLPLHVAGAHPGAGVHASKRYACPPELEGLSILVVDDDEDAREVIKELLQQCEISVTLASSGEDGLRAIAKARPDILISDIGMPGLDGYEFITRVRALAVDAGGQVPAIALTAFGRTQDRMRALGAGFNNHVPKPVEAMELLAVLSSLARQMRTVPSAR